MTTIPVAMSLNGLRLLDPLTLAQEAARQNPPLPVGHWLNMANRFTTATGANPGVGAVLMLHRDFIKIPSGTITACLSFQEDTTTLKLENLVVVQAEAIYAAGAITPETAYLVHLADRRLLMFQSSVDTDYNVISPDGVNFFDDSLNSSVEWTWQQLLDDLWNSIPTSLRVNSSAPQLSTDTNVAFELTDNPENLRFHGISAWEAINIVLDRLNFTARVQHDGNIQYIPNWIDTLDTSGTFSATKAFTKKQTRGLDFAHILESTIPRIPETIRIFFPSRETSTVDGKKYLRPSEAETVDIATSSVAEFETLTTLAGTVKIIWDETEAIFDGAGVNTNSSELSSRATELATAFLNSDPSIQHDHRIYSGLLIILPGTNARTVLWYDVGGGLKTEITQRPSSAIPVLTGRVKPIERKDDRLSSEGFSVTPVETSNHSPISGEYVPIDSTGGTFTGTLPASPTFGDRIKYIDVGEYVAINNVTIDGNGTNINGSATYVMDTNGTSFELIYDGTQWVIRGPVNDKLGFTDVPFPARLWWSETSSAEIRDATLVPGSSQTVLTTGEDVTRTLTSEAENKRVYWGNNTDRKIKRIDWDGENKNDVVNLSAGSQPIHSLEYYAGNRFLYWFRATAILRAEAITVTALGIAVSPVLSQTAGTSGFLHIARYAGIDSIFYSRFSGTGSTISRVPVTSTPTDWSPVVLRTTGGSNIMFAMAVNEITSEIFWFEKNIGSGNIDLKRGTLTATSITGVTTPVADLVDLTTFEIKIDAINQRIVFTGKIDVATEGILSCNFDGSDLEVLQLLTGANRATGIEFIDDGLIAAISALTPVVDQLQSDIDDKEILSFFFG